MNEIDVEVSNMQAQLTIDPAWIEQVVATTLQIEQIFRASISIGLATNASIRVINARHLGHDWPTDVVSFPYSDAGDGLLLGELVISTEMAVETADQVGCEPLDEVALYLVHGLLHLCGHDDRTPAEAALMRQREAAVLAELQIENPFHRVDGLATLTGDSGRESVRWPR